MNLDPNPSDFLLQGKSCLPAGNDLTASATLVDGIQAQLVPDFSSLNLNEKKVALVKTSNLVIVEKFILKAMKHCNEKSAIISFNHPEMTAKRLEKCPQLISSLQLGENEDGTGELDFNKLITYLETNESEFYDVEREKYRDYVLKSTLPKELHWGNCHEMASYYYKYFDERLPQSINIDMVSIGFGDHAFLLINRPLNVKVTDYDQLKETLVFDPWSGTWYYAPEIPKKLKDYRRWNAKTFRPVLGPFNRYTQSLVLRFPRFFLKEEILFSNNKILVSCITNKHKNSRLDQISKLLDTFNASTDLEKKVELAENITKLLGYRAEITNEIEILLKHNRFHRSTLESNLDKLKEYMGNFLSTFKDDEWITKSAKYPNRQPFVPFNHPEKYGVVL